MKTQNKYGLLVTACIEAVLKLQKVCWANNHKLASYHIPLEQYLAMEKELKGELRQIAGVSIVPIDYQPAGSFVETFSESIAEYEARIHHPAYPPVAIQHRAWLAATPVL